MISDEKRRILLHLWQTEADDFCSTTWRADLTDEEEALVNSWDDEYNEQDYYSGNGWNDLSDEELIMLDMMTRV